MRTPIRSASIVTMWAVLTTLCVETPASAQDDGARRGERLVTLGGGHHSLVRPREMNVIDEAHYAIAGILVDEQKYEGAIQEFERVTKKSPNKGVVAVAHLNIGNIRRRFLDDPTSAINEYVQVTGKFAEDAVAAIMDTCESMGNADRAGEMLEGLAAEAKGPRVKIRLLRTAAEFYRQHDRKDKAVAVLRRITEAVTYKEAERTGPIPV